MSSYSLDQGDSRDSRDSGESKDSRRAPPVAEAGYSLEGGGGGGGGGRETGAGAGAGAAAGFPATVEKAISIYPVLKWSAYTLIICTVDDRVREASEHAFEAYRRCPSASLRQHTHVHNLALGERLPPFLKSVPVVFVRENGGLIQSVDHIREFFARFEPRQLHGAILASAQRSGGSTHARRRGHMLTVMGGIREGDRDEDRAVVSSGEKRAFGGPEATGGGKPVRRTVKPSEDSHSAATHRKWIKDGGGGSGRSSGGGGGGFDTGFGL